MAVEDIEVQIDGRVVTIDFSSSDLEIETLSERLYEILPLLFSLLSADTIRKNSEPETTVLRERGFLAVDMLFQHTLLKAIERAELLGAIAEGKESIEDHGFPEFRDTEF